MYFYIGPPLCTIQFSSVVLWNEMCIMALTLFAHTIIRYIAVEHTHVTSNMFFGLANWVHPLCGSLLYTVHTSYVLKYTEFLIRFNYNYLVIVVIIIVT